MDRWTGKVALVTGASAGIGAQITRELAKNGLKVIPVARRLDKLRELAASIKRELEIDVYPMKCDVQKEEDILNVFKWADAQLGGIDVLINNAGVAVSEPIIDGSVEIYRQIMEVNVIAAAICSRELVRSIKKRKASGHIIIICSATGHYTESIDIPLSLYCASKCALIGMTHSLRNELAIANLDIKVTNLSPGLVDTDFPNAALPEPPMKHVPMLRSKDIADAVIYILGASHNAQIFELIVGPTSGSIVPKLNAK